MALEEKNELTYIPTLQSEDPEKNELVVEHTLEHVDIENRQAFKGDDSDGKIEFTFKKAAAAWFLAMLYTGSQILLYFIGGALSFIVAGLHTNAATGWLPVANTLAIGSVSPFVGYLQDLLGKRYIALGGSIFIIVGCVLVGTAHTFGQAIAGMAIAGAGAAIGELTSLAGLAETVPVKYRGYSMALLTAFVLPFTPYNIYSQLYSEHSTWRWGPYICIIYNAIAGVGLLFFYHPHNHTRAEGFSYRAILKRIDHVGGVLSITGLTIFLVALQAGGYTHSWTSAYVLCTLLIGLFSMIAWFIWEWKFAKYPMVPHELFANQKVVQSALLVVFVSGFNYLLLVFWPLVVTNLYPNPQDPIKVGLKGFPIVISVTCAAVFWNVLISFWRGSAKWVLFMGATLLTAFGGALAVMTPDNPKLAVALSCFVGFGLGGVIVPPATVAMIGAPDALISTAAALSLSLRAVGGSIGYSIYYNIWVGKLKKKLPTYVAEYAVKAGLPLADVPTFVGTFLTKPEMIAKVPGVTPAILGAAATAVKWAYADSFRYIWYTSIAFGVLTMCAALLIPNTRRFETNRIAVAL
ncbi:putative major facilitator superfamily transporter [Lepidopterella palustris CBS 459.81]|uniref:Putative major facilitator superfamily transporter n=1 Tax=Lepidopterella palustris CBS 459.81 TaxID=1314670 RepID=A0A8E2E293_9PEZI|nr:putative major facilitator superfamily transporter [Lepidopterella palustris CBS 459.81]